MKKILFSLVALVCSMSMNAQVVKLYKGETLVAVFAQSQVDRFEFGELNVPTGSMGTAKRTGDIDVAWVQLWENGPKWAVYNVGASNEGEPGGLYAWGGSVDCPKVLDYCEEFINIQGTKYDTAKNLWGDNWQMPTKEDFDALLANCDYEHVSNYNNLGIDGMLFTGKGFYATNSMLLPCAGWWSMFYHTINGKGTNDYYHSATPYGNPDKNQEYSLWIYQSKDIEVFFNNAQHGYSVRAVLAE